MLLFCIAFLCFILQCIQLYCLGLKTLSQIPTGMGLCQHIIKSYVYTRSNHVCKHGYIALSMYSRKATRPYLNLQVHGYNVLLSCSGMKAVVELN